jgi:hypothetical protein
LYSRSFCETPRFRESIRHSHTQQKKTKIITSQKLHVLTSITLQSTELFLNFLLLSSTLFPSRTCTLPLGAEKGRICPLPLTLPLTLSLLFGLLLITLLRPSSLLLSPLILFLPFVSLRLLLLLLIVGFGGLGFLSSFGFLLWRAFLGFVFGAGRVFVGAAAGFVFFADFGGLWWGLLVGGS